MKPNRLRKMNTLKHWLVASAFGLTLAAESHEFWVMPDRFTVPVGGQVEFALNVGENFVGTPAGFGRPMALSFSWFNQMDRTDLTDNLPATLEHNAASMAFNRSGTQLIALDTKPQTLEMPADRFNAYLKDEGLDSVLRARADQLRDAEPGRERYRRHVKTLVTVGGKSDATYSKKTGQILEIVPLSNPRIVKSGGVLRFRLYFNGQPLGGALVKLWNQRGHQLTVLRTRSDRRGELALAMPWPGVWMASVVHMVPSEGEAEFDWDSHWGNLTFQVGD